MKEADVLRAVTDYLSAKRYLWFRMNTGAVKLGKRFLRFGVVGMADLLCFCEDNRTVWIECKQPGKYQTPEQKSFQKMVEGNNHKYLVVRSVDDLRGVL